MTSVNLVALVGLNFQIQLPPSRYHLKYTVFIFSIHPSCHVCIFSLLFFGKGKLAPCTHFVAFQAVDTPDGFQFL